MDVSVPAGKFNCFVLASNIQSAGNFLFNDYINLDYGLIKRELILDSLAIMNSDGEIIQIVRQTQKSELVGTNIIK